jgi:protein required for attachment to host cells
MKSRNCQTIATEDNDLSAAPKQAAIRFAKEVVDELEAARHAKRFEAFCVAASPHFLGLLRERMSDALGRSVKGDLPKDLTREDAASVQSYVAHLLYGSGDLFGGWRSVGN